MENKSAMWKIIGASNHTNWEKGYTGKTGVSWI